jgi:hypothetical protein
VLDLAAADPEVIETKDTLKGARSELDLYVDSSGVVRARRMGVESVI